MPKLRQNSIDYNHQRFADLTKNWTPDFGEGSLSKYLVKHGIEHLFEVGDKNGVRDRLLDLHFFNELYETIEWTGVLQYWQDLGEEENASEAYLQLVEEALSGEVDKTLLDTIKF